MQVKRLVGREAECGGSSVRYLDPRMAFKQRHERKIGLLVRLFRDKIEIPDRLMVVDGKDELDFRHDEWESFVFMVF